MLVLSKDGIRNYDDSLKQIDISNPISIYNVMEHYRSIFEYNGLHHSTEYALDSILDWVEESVIDTFDYRNEQFEDDLISLSETMSDLPDSLLFDPIFELLTESQDYITSNKKLFNKHQRKGMDVSSIDDIFNQLGFLGCIEQSSMERYKATLEFELESLNQSLYRELVGMGPGADLSDDNDMGREPSSIPQKEPADEDSMTPYRFRVIADIYNQLLDNTLNSSDLNGVSIQELLCIPLSQLSRSGNDSQTDLLSYRIVTYLNYLGDIIDEASDCLDKGNFIKYILQVGEYLKSYICETSIYIMRCLYIYIINRVENNSSGLLAIRKLIGWMVHRKPSDKEDHSFNTFQLYNEYITCSDSFRKYILNYGEFNFDGEYEFRVMPVNYRSSYGLSSNYLSESEQFNESSHFMNAIAERFDVRRDGTIKITLDERTTFMNEYGVNHRLTKMNYKQGDYEALKYNLVVNMILIDIIEKEVLYNPSISKKSRKYRDAEKARSFALNDISTYLPIVKDQDPSFDLNKFYEEMKTDKNSIEINGTETVAGLKKIFNSILLS